MRSHAEPQRSLVLKPPEHSKLGAIGACAASLDASARIDTRVLGSSVVELSGALYEPALLEKLNRLNGLRKRLLAETAEASCSHRQLPLRSGTIKKTAIQVLELSPEPMRACDVHVAIERILSMAVSRHSVNSCLFKGSKGEDACFVQVGHGRYRLPNAESDHRGGTDQ